VVGALGQVPTFAPSLRRTSFPMSAQIPSGIVRAGGANVREPIDGNGERQERCVNTSIEHHPLRHNIVKGPRPSSLAQLPMILELYRALPTAAAKSIRAQGF